MKNKDWKLFESIKINRLLLNNRLVMLPMSNELHDSRGEVTPRMVDFYRERARGGVGLIIIELTLVTDDHKASHLNISSDNFISGLSELAEAIQSHGARASIQIGHRGSQHAAIPPVNDMDEAGIQRIIEAFGLAAARAKRAGFDAVEIHGGHGYLINQFLSGLSNNRTDQYGGSLEKRKSFAVQVYRRVRESVGKNFPISFRLSGSEFNPAGIDVAETCSIAKTLEEEGVDIISVSAGNRESLEWVVQPMAQPRACLAFITDEVKKTVNIPVLIAGRINDPVLANSILTEGRADLIGMARGLTADPDLPRKALCGKLDDIRKCIACNYCHGIRHVRRQPVRCAINAAVGREKETITTPASKRKKVMVVGGGPGGMECAYVLNQRGHEVLLFEKGARLGGKLWVAAAPPHKEEIDEFREFLNNRLKRSSITVNLNHEVDDRTIETEKPDALVFATGAKPFLPPIPGLKDTAFYFAENVFFEGIKADDIVIIGGGQVGCELGEFLLEQGKKITIVEILPKICADVEFLNRKLLLKRIGKLNPKIVTGATISEVDKEKLIYLDKEGKEKYIEFGAIVVAAGYQPDEALFHLRRYAPVETHFVGDCVGARGIYAAIREGNDVGCRV